MVVTVAGTASSAPAQAPPTTITGVLRDATTGAGLQGGCIAALAVGSSGQPTFSGVNGDGSWNVDPGAAGDYNLAFYSTGSGNCGDPIQGTPVPSWFENQPLNGTDPSTIVPPSSATAVAAGTSGIVACLGETSLPQSCAEPDVELSGTVVTVDLVPVEAACIYILGPRSVGQAITDAQGRWTVTGQPVASQLVVGVVPPFDAGNGPCVANNGPPPAPPPGALQPVFYKDIWIDLNNPALGNDANGFALAAGATPFTSSTAGIITCLTSAAADVVPRPSCDPAAPPTTSPPVTAPGSAVAPVTLPASGNQSEPLMVAAAGLGLIGAIIVLVSRRRSVSRP